ncbi:MAG TPA: twin-arginine translocation signal domain-containing protein [Bacteroidia bacterium]|nr:twin-arginine translocation signal domain-containing protein [Bacteroidia bacterium]
MKNQNRRHFLKAGTAIGATLFASSTLMNEMQMQVVDQTM